ncbi:MAG: protein-tyrosine phosphatase family protein [Pyrinomonadaceae bacterium]
MKPTIYWIDRPGPGRLAILARPRGEDWLEDEIQEWREAGVDVVVSMLTAPENLQLGLNAEAELCRTNGLQFISFPIEDFGVPDSVDATIKRAKELNDLFENGKSIGFHCRGCLGRAPLIASCVLMLSGETTERSFELVSAARGYLIPETPEQAAWGKDFALQLNSSAHS